MRRSLLAMLGVGCLLTGCGLSAQDRATSRPDDEVPFSLLDPAAEPSPPVTAPGTATVPVQLCFHDGTGLVMVERALEPPVRLLEATRALASPAAGGGPEGLSSAVAEPGFVQGAILTAGVAAVDLATSFASLGADHQLLAIAQIVCTLTARPGVGQVAFSLDGAPIEVPRPDGSIAPGPVARDDYTVLMRAAP